VLAIATGKILMLLDLEDQNLLMLLVNKRRRTHQCLRMQINARPEEREERLANTNLGAPKPRISQLIRQISNAKNFCN